MDTCTDTTGVAVCSHTVAPSVCSAQNFLNSGRRDCATFVCDKTDTTAENVARGGCKVESEITCIFGNALVNGNGMCACNCEPSLPNELFPTAAGLAKLGFLQTPDCRHAFHAPWVHKPFDGPQGNPLTLYSDLLGPIIKRDIGDNFIKDYQVTLVGTGEVRELNNRGKCRRTQQLWNEVQPTNNGVLPTGCLQTVDISVASPFAAAAIPPLELSNNAVKNANPEKFIADFNDVFPFNEPFLGDCEDIPCPFLGYNQSTTEQASEDRTLLRVDVMRNTKAGCIGCAIPVVDTIYMAGINPDLWSKTGVLADNITYTNNQLAFFTKKPPVLTGDVTLSPRGDHQFQEVFALATGDPVVDPLLYPNLWLKKGSSMISGLNSGAPKYFALELEPVFDINSVAANVADKAFFHPHSRVLFNTNDTDVLNMIGAYTTARGPGWALDLPALTCPELQTCLNGCKFIFESVLPKLLDGRQTLSNTIYPDVVAASDTFNFYGVVSYLGPATTSQAYMTKCNAAVCC